jgi:cephalosporin hydroxylase
VVIDDCAHAAGPQIATFEAFWPHIRSGGVHIVEDINFSSYNDTWYEKRVGKGPRSVMPFLQEKLDELIVADSYGKGYWEKGAHTTDMAFIHFYKHVAIIGKK